MNISSFNVPLLSKEFSNISSTNMNINTLIIDNETPPLLPLNHQLILSLFILSISGILLSIIISFLYVYFSSYRTNLINLFLCLSVCFIYLIVILFLLRGNELFCSLREFLSQLAFALLFSALLCRYIMQWLSARILSKRTQQLTSLLIYSLLIFIQIPIGIIWWYFTSPRVCHQQTLSDHPYLAYSFQKHITSIMKLCSFHCVVDYRFYATLTYTILELFLCTIIATCLFLFRNCNEIKNEKDQLLNTDRNNNLLVLLNLFAFVLIDIVWLMWTTTYYFTHPSFVFPALVIGMFTIATICLLFIVIPQVYVNYRTSSNEMNLSKVVIYSNRLASMDDVQNYSAFPDDISNDPQKPTTMLSNQSELSYELATSGTFLPITRTPKGQFKLKAHDRKVSNDNFDHFIESEHDNNKSCVSNNCDKFIANEQEIHQQNQSKTSNLSSQHQLTSNSKIYDCINPTLRKEHMHRMNSNTQPSISSLHYPSNNASYYDETMIPILCSSQRSHTSTPVRIHKLPKQTPSSVPIKRRFYADIDHRHVRHPHHYILPYSTTSPINALYYSPRLRRDDIFIDPCRNISSYANDRTGQPMFSSPQFHPHSYRRFHRDNRSLSQRLWDIDSGDDEDECHENIFHTRGYLTPMKERLRDFHSSQIENDDHLMMHIDDDVDDDIDDDVDDANEHSYTHKLLHV